ncbi:MAG: glycerol kinase GlpK [Eubacteriales bacterium]
MRILALDQGTTSSRAILFDEKGNPLASASCPLTQYYPNPGWVEHDPMEIFSTQMSAAETVLQNVTDKIDGIGISNQRETVIVWDRETGLPIQNAIVWQCRRTADLAEELIRKGYSEAVKQTTGLKIDAYFSATKIRWILDHNRDARERAKRGELLCGTVDSWLIWKLTGRHVTDVTNASRTMLFDIRTLCWDPMLCGLLDIPMSMLPEIIPNCGVIAKVKRDPSIPEALWSVPICASIGDQQAALFGQACFEAGDVKNTYGTGCFTLMNIGEKPVFDENIVTTVAWKIGDQVTYALEGSVFNAGSSIQWLRDELHLISTAHECDLLAESVDSTGGVTFVSAFTGLGAPHWDMYARGTLVGLTRGSGRAEICRAVLEGIAFQVYDLAVAMEKGSGCPITTLRVDGGASVSNFMMQFQADLLNVPVDRPVNVESTALGAASLALLALEGCTFDELPAIRTCDRIFLPAIDKTRRDKELDRWYKAVESAKKFE